MRWMTWRTALACPWVAELGRCLIAEQSIALLPATCRHCGGGTFTRTLEGRCRLTASNLVLKAPMVSAPAYGFSP